MPWLLRFCPKVDAWHSHILWSRASHRVMRDIARWHPSLGEVCAGSVGGQHVHIGAQGSPLACCIPPTPTPSIAHLPTYAHHPRILSHALSACPHSLLHTRAPALSTIPPSIKHAPSGCRPLHAHFCTAPHAHTHTLFLSHRRSRSTWPTPTSTHIHDDIVLSDTNIHTHSF